MNKGRCVRGKSLLPCIRKSSLNKVYKLVVLAHLLLYEKFLIECLRAFDNEIFFFTMGFVVCLIACVTIVFAMGSFDDKQQQRRNPHNKYVMCSINDRNESGPDRMIYIFIYDAFFIVEITNDKPWCYRSSLPILRIVTFMKTLQHVSFRSN